MGVAALFYAMDISVENACELFGLLDVDDSGPLKVEEFVEGCLRLRGTAKTTDIRLLLHESKATCSKLALLAKYFEEDFLTDIEEQVVGSLAQHLDNDYFCSVHTSSGISL